MEHSGLNQDLLGKRYLTAGLGASGEPPGITVAQDRDTFVVTHVSPVVTHQKTWKESE